MNEVKDNNLENKKDIKTIISENITKHRKLLGLTQLELAEKLNYSDKTLSKWERGEAIPDVITLNELASIFKITVDELISEEGTNTAFVRKTDEKVKLSYRNIVSINLLSVGIVWLVAVIVFVLLSLIAKDLQYLWMIFVYAIPVSSIVLLVFACIWGNKFMKFITTSILIWTLTLTLQLILTIFFMLPDAGLLYIIPIPIQIMAIIFFFGLKSKKKTNN